MFIYTSFRGVIVFDRKMLTLFETPNMLAFYKRTMRISSNFEGYQQYVHAEFKENLTLLAMRLLLGIVMQEKAKRPFFI